MTDQPDRSQPGNIPDPAAPPPPAPDGTSEPQSAAPDAQKGGATPPVSGQPWSTPSGDPLSPEPYQPPPVHTPPAYAPGYAPIPEPDYPPTSQFPAPPVNYAPPGYAPDYGYAPGGYPPPGGYPGRPPGYPPGPPPRRSSAPLIAVIVAVTLLLCGGIATAGVLIARNVADQAKEAVAPITDVPTEAPDLPGLPTVLPNDPGSGASHTIDVTYEVTGDGPVEIIYIEKIGSAPVQLDDVKLPWKFTAQVQTPALLSVVAMRVDSSKGSIRCRALVDGDEVKKSSSGQSNFATASCTYFALD